MVYFLMDWLIKVMDLLVFYVELQDLVLRFQLWELVFYIVCLLYKKELEQFVLDDGIYKEQVLVKCFIMFDFLEDYFVCEMLFEWFLVFLLLLKLRYYFILSLLKVYVNIVSMIVGVVKVLVWSG